MCHNAILFVEHVFFLYFTEETRPMLCKKPTTLESSKSSADLRRTLFGNELSLLIEWPSLTFSHALLSSGGGPTIASDDDDGVSAVVDSVLPV